MGTVGPREWGHWLQSAGLGVNEGLPDRENVKTDEAEWHSNELVLPHSDLLEQLAGWLTNEAQDWQ